MKQYFRDAYGCTASIQANRDGSASLRIADAHGKIMWCKTYATERGAKIAMGRMMEDYWKQNK